MQGGNCQQAIVLITIYDCICKLIWDTNIACHLKVEGVRLYADQALYKEPHGGYTPWHCDASYWPLATDKVVSAWIPLQVCLS